MADANKEKEKDDFSKQEIDEIAIKERFTRFLNEFEEKDDETNTWAIISFICISSVIGLLIYEAINEKSEIINRVSDVLSVFAIISSVISFRSLRIELKLLHEMRVLESWKELSESNLKVLLIDVVKTATYTLLVTSVGLVILRLYLD